MFKNKLVVAFLRASLVFLVVILIAHLIIDRLAPATWKPQIFWFFDLPVFSALQLGSIWLSLRSQDKLPASAKADDENVTKLISVVEALTQEIKFWREEVDKLRDEKSNMLADAESKLADLTSKHVQRLARDVDEYSQQRRWANALEVINELLKHLPDNPALYTTRGVFRAQLGDLDMAIADFSTAVRLNPNDAVAYSNRGLARTFHGDLDGAILDITEAIRLNPNNAPAYNNRGIARYEQGDLTGAITDYTEAIRLDPKYANPYNNRGNARALQGDLVGAISDFEMTLKLDPELKNASTRLSLTFQALGRIDEAQTRWRALIYADPRYRDADWVGKELKWRPELVEEARKLIASLAD